MGGIFREGNGSIAGGVSGQIRGGQIGGITNELEQIACISPFTQRQMQSAETLPEKRKKTVASSFLIMRFSSLYVPGLG